MKQCKDCKFKIDVPNGIYFMCDLNKTKLIKIKETNNCKYNVQRENYEHFTYAGPNGFIWHNKKDIGRHFKVAIQSLGENGKYEETTYRYIRQRFNGQTTSIVAEKVPNPEDKVSIDEWDLFELPAVFSNMWWIEENGNPVYSKPRNTCENPLAKGKWFDGEYFAHEYGTGDEYGKWIPARGRILITYGGAVECEVQLKKPYNKKYWVMEGFWSEHNGATPHDIERITKFWSGTGDKFSPNVDITTTIKWKGEKEND